MRTLVMRGDSTLRDVAYAALGQLLRGLFGLTRSTAPDVALEQLQAWVAHHTPEWQPRLALLRDVLDLPIPPTPLTAGLSAEQRQEALANLVADLVEYACRQQPLLILVEDSRYIDEATWVAMTEPARRLAALPLLVAGLRADRRRAGPDRRACRGDGSRRRGAAGRGGNRCAGARPTPSAGG